MTNLHGADLCDIMHTTFIINNYLFFFSVSGWLSGGSQWMLRTRGLERLATVSSSR